MNFLNLKMAREAYARGENITAFLRQQISETDNTSSIIEISYDLQAGTYIAHAKKNRDQLDRYASELAALLDPHLTDQGTLLDIGAGELTTLSHVINHLRTPLSEVFAFDISWSRLWHGRSYFEKNCKREAAALHAFVADIKQIPLTSNSIDVVTSNHALEPNGSNLPEILQEVFRVARKTCVLFEPSYENNTAAGQARMDQLGYIKNVEGTVNALGGRVLEMQMISKPGNPLNPTACFAIEPPTDGTAQTSEAPEFSVPGSDFPLIQDGAFYGSADTGLIYPVLKGIPIFKTGAAIVATANFTDI